MNSIERTGENFDRGIYFEARSLCQDVVANIASHVVTGMTEEDGQHLIKEEFKKGGISKFWHPSKFRIAADTMKSFRELPDPSISLSPGEIFFVDVGPIIDGHEADFGKTFIFEDPQKDDELQALALGAEKVWQHTAEVWRERGLSGQGLLDCAEDYCRSLGYKLNPMMAGHRLGDFPHALYSKDRLFTLDLVPSPDLWVLEILIVSENLSRGAFFEDILTA